MVILLDTTNLSHRLAVPNRTEQASGVPDVFNVPSGKNTDQCMAMIRARSGNDAVALA